MKKIKILYVVPSLRLCNGVASYAMNYFRHIDKEKFQIDFLIGLNERSPYFDEIEQIGSKIFYIEQINIKNCIKQIKNIDTFYKEHSEEYDIMHCHVLNSGLFHLKYAKKYGIKKRILHSHATQYADKKLNAIRNAVMAEIAKKYASDFASCSKLAGDFLFRNKKYFVINNAIDIDKFSYNSTIRDKLKKEEKILNDTKVIGNIGRFVPQKNQLFLIEILKLVVEKNENVKLLLIGSGPLEEQLLSKIKKYNLENNVILKKNITNVNEYMQIMDIFVLPSLYEGFPVVGVEAQATGIKCLFSDTITAECKLMDETEFLSIDNVEIWVKKCLENIEIDRLKINENLKKYEISSQTKKLEEYYSKI